MGRIKVLLLDDKEIPREALARLLDEQEHIEVVSRCSNIKKALEEVKRTGPDLVLVDSNLSGCKGSEATRQINESAPEVKVAVLTDSKEQDDMVSAIESGATGYLHKESTVDTFVESIEIVGKGGVVKSSQVAGKLGGKLSSIPANKNRPRTGLTEQETEVVKLLAQGATNKEIAETLYIAENTAKVHLKNILGKLKLRNRQQIAAYAIKEGLVTDITALKKKSDTA
jgi:DNA-binding NarL/FixJ family response regulator